MVTSTTMKTILFLSILTFTNITFGATRTLSKPREYTCTLPPDSVAGAICFKSGEVVSPLMGPGFPPIPGVVELKISGWNINAVMGITTSHEVIQGLQVVYRTRSKGRNNFGEWQKASSLYNTGGGRMRTSAGQYAANAFVSANQTQEYQFGIRFYRGALVDTASATLLVTPVPIL